MAKNEKTSKDVASLASKVLQGKKPTAAEPGVITCSPVLRHPQEQPQ